MAPWSILFRATLPAHDALIFGVERLLGQILVALGAAETLLMPVATLMVELLMARVTGERCNQEGGINRWTYTLDSTGMGRWHSAQELAQNLV